MTHVWRYGKTHEAAAKGAPEAIAALCHLGPRAMEDLAKAIEEMAARGLRVLGVARATCKGRAWPENQKDCRFTFLGLVGLADPLRPSVPAAISECRSAGIRVMMITGDYPATAVAIARQAGLQTDEVITGSDLRGMDDAALAARLQHQPVFARIMPEQKLRIVEALKRQDQVVAMTGDGVNDAPSLKAAHIGIAMGGRGTDVAREASSIVLLDDDFSSIVKAVRLGRRIYDNLRKASGFIFAIHMPIAGLAILPLVLNLPIILGPMHIALLEMIIDPVCTLVFEAEEEEADTMQRPPRPPREPLFSNDLIGWSLAQGVVALTIAAGVFLAANRWGIDEATVRALTFVTLVLVIVSLILVDRSYSSSLWAAISRRNRALAIVLAVIAALLAVVLLLPVARDLFKFGALNMGQMSIALAAGIAVLLVLEMVKPLLRTTRR
jgi:Ca2+-transporting ATPase